MKLQILTPDKSVFDDEVDGLLVPGSTGPFEVLKDHAPILSSLVAGELRVKIAHKENYFSIAGGFFEFHNNQAVILATAAETPKEIDIKRMEAAKQKARLVLENPSEAILEKAEAKLAYARAQARHKVSEKLKA